MLDVLKWSLSLLGHLAVWCVVYNNVHATAFPRRWRKLTEKLVIVSVVLPGLWVLFQWIRLRSAEFERTGEASLWALWYGKACIVIGCLFAARWIFRKIVMRRPSAVIERRRELIAPGKESGRTLYRGTPASWLGRIPGNQATVFSVEWSTMQFSELPAGLKGLKIAHLSDLHFTGLIAPEFFEAVVEKTNEFKPDLIVITGDIVDEVECLDWVTTILGKLEARKAKVAIRGNHDRRISDESQLLSRLKAAGFEHANGQRITLEFGDSKLEIVGNELPWYPGAESLSADASQTSKRLGDRDTFRMLMSHSPDQIGWARPFGFDLMLAGHTHGGQIQLPIIGPVVAPSKYGVKYCGGTYQIGGMLVHVSRGLSGDDPIRLNCPPELALITLVGEGSPIEETSNS